MKTHSIPFALSLLVSTFWQSSQLAGQAASLYWDVNGTGTGFSTVVGGWNGTNAFWNDISSGTGGTPIALTTNVDDLNIVAATTNTGTITVTGAQVANSITYGSTVGAVTISGGTSITLGNGTADAGGITVNSGAGAQIISTAIVLANSQTWTNNSTNTLTTNGGLNLGANTLTFSGSGNISFGTVAASVISGNGSIVMNGTGLLQLGAAATVPVHTYSGGTTITNGTVMFSGNLPANGNLTLNGGVYQEYFGSSFTRALGAGSGQIQITGGASGFSGQGATATTFNIGGAAATLVWGSAFFNPSTFILQAANAGVNTNGKMTLSNGINLSGSDRIIASNQTTDGVASSGATIAGVISNSTGTAGFEKTGVGNLILSNAANTFNGALTITGGWITAAGSGSLGNASATNTLIFNGGTLRASAAITSPAARGVTMTSTGIIDTNTFAVSIAGNIAGAGGLTKNSTGTLTLSGTNSYSGVTTVNAGTLAITKEAALASNTAANLNVKSGAGLAINVDSAGAAGFSVANLDTLLGNILVATTSAQGLQAGSTLALDTTTATGATFTLGNAIANSTGAFGGVISLTKLGTGILILDTSNTYTGPTAIAGGSLQLGSGSAGGSLSAGSGINIGTGATFAVNQTDTVTQGTEFGSLSGLGGFTQAGSGTTIFNQANTFSGTTTVGAGTLTLSNALALQNSALVTTTGTSTMGAFSSVTIGGLSGATGDLGSANVLSGYTGNVSALTLNPQTGVSVTYGGVISNGSGAMTLTKTGAGTQILTGANTYTGATIVNAGTLSVGVGGSLSSSSALQINGGTYSYGNTAAGQTLDGLAVGGNSTVSNTAAGQTLTLGAITRTASIFGTVNFATLTGPISTTTGNVNSIIGPWATTGSGTTLRYAVGSSDGVTATNITPFTSGTTATANTLANVTDATLNYEYSAAVAAMPASTALTGNTLRYSGGITSTVIDGTSTLTLNGLMQAGTGLLTISGGPSTGGILIGSTGELVIAANAQATTISAAIGGTGRLVYNGAGSILLLSSASSDYSGGTVINGGQLRIASNAALGNSTGSITLNGGTLLGNNTNPQSGNGGGVNITSARDVIVGIAGGSIGAHGNNNFTTTGILSGSGTLTFLELGGAGGRALNFNSTANTFTGRIVIPSVESTLSVNSLVDTAGSGNIALNLAAATTNTGCTFAYGAGAIAPLTLNNRAFELNASGAFTGTIQNNNTTQPISIGSNLIATGAGAKTLVLGAVAGPNNIFSGKISNGPGSVISLSVTGAGHWIVSGNNTYTGQTTVSGSAGAALTLSGDNSGTSGNVVLSTATGIVGSSPRLNINSATALGTGILNFGGGAASDVVRIDNTSAGTVNVSTANAITMNRNFTFIGTQDLSLGTGTTTLGGMTTGSNRSITVTAKTLTLNGPIAEAVTNLGINKAGAGTLVLSGPGNTYTGATTVSAGTLVGTNATQSFGTNLSGISIAGAGTLSLRNDSTVSFTNGTSAYNIANSASGATINVDRVTGTGTNTITVGNLTTTSTAGAWGLNFTGANGVSLSAGALNTPVSTIAAVHTITNNIAGGGSLTLASVFNKATTVASPDLVFTGSGNTIVTGAITQTLADMELKKSGSGTLLLNGINTYIGLTTVNDGTLGGTGTIAGSVTVASAGSLAPGASAGTLSIGGELTVTAMATGTGKLKFELGANTASSDQIAVTGALTTGGQLGFSDFTFTFLPGGPQNGNYTLITTGADPTGTLDGSDLSGPIGAGGTGTLAISGNNIVLNVTGLGGDPYAIWSSGAAFDLDTNGDGVQNGLAWLLGAANPNVDAIGLLPKVSQSGGDLVMSFTCLKLAGRGAATLKLQHSKDLGITDPWTVDQVSVPDTAGSAGVTDIVVFTIPSVNGDPNLVNLQATIPASAAASGTTLFGRLKAEK